MTANTVQSTLKSHDTEEHIDLYFTRPIGLLWARLFKALGIHPNVVTIISILLGIAAGGCMALGENSYGYTLLGIGLLVWANLLDSADGQLARMTGQKTRWGRILDGFAGDVWFVCIYAAIAFRLMPQAILPTWEASPTWSWWIFAVLYYHGFYVHAVQSRLADYYRNVHLYFLKGKAGSELDHSTQLRSEWHNVSWRNAPWKVFLYFYGNYTAGQERDTPRFQALRQALATRYPEGDLPERLVEDFLRGSRPLMKWTNFLSFNWRAFTLYASLLLAVHHPWCVLLYPLAEFTLFHAVYHYMRLRHEQLCARLLADYQLDNSPSHSR